MELIDKAALVAEIERRKRKLLDNIICEGDKEWVVRTAHQLNRILLFLDTLEMKEVDLELSWEDIEKITDIWDDLHEDETVYIKTGCDTPEFYQEVLKRFNKERKEK